MLLIRIEEEFIIVFGCSLLLPLTLFVCLFVRKFRGSNQFKNMQSLRFMAAADRVNLSRNSSLKYRGFKKKKKDGKRQGKRKEKSLTGNYSPLISVWWR